MSLLATCATLAAVLASAQGGETINLEHGSDCEAVAVSKHYTRQVTINAGYSTVRGLTISGSNVRWRSGVVMATGGAFAIGPRGYGVRITGANIMLDGVLVTAAKKGIAVVGARNVSIVRSRFRAYGEDGIIASRTIGLRVEDNSFADVIGKPRECEVDGVISYGTAKRDCTGTWRDGFHADAVQMRDGVTDAVIRGNVVRGETQGLTQMDTTGDAPLARVLIADNDIETSGYHPITLGECIDCRIENNAVRRTPGSDKRAVILAGKATRCGNYAPDDRIVDGACF